MTFTHKGNPVAPAVKYCPSCNASRLSTTFPKSKLTRDGYFPVCSFCIDEEQAQKREAVAATHLERIQLSPKSPLVVRYAKTARS